MDQITQLQILKITRQLIRKNKLLKIYEKSYEWLRSDLFTMFITHAICIISVVLGSWFYTRHMDISLVVALFTGLAFGFVALIMTCIVIYSVLEVLDYKITDTKRQIKYLEDQKHLREKNWYKKSDLYGTLNKRW